MLAQWDIYMHMLGSNHVPISIHLNTGGPGPHQISTGSYMRTAYNMHWDKYQCICCKNH